MSNMGNAICDGYRFMTRPLTAIRTAASYVALHYVNAMDVGIFRDQSQMSQPAFTEREVDLAARIRVRAFSSGLPIVSLIGRRGALKLEISKALASIGQLPVTGPLVIQEVYFTAEVYDGYSVGRYGPKGMDFSRFNEVHVLGFRFRGTIYELKQPYSFLVRPADESNVNPVGNPFPSKE